MPIGGYMYSRGFKFHLYKKNQSINSMYTDLTTAKKNRIKKIKKQQNRCCIYPVSLLHYTLKGIQQDLLPHPSPNLVNQGKSPADNSSPNLCSCLVPQLWINNYPSRLGHAHLHQTTFHVTKINKTEKSKKQLKQKPLYFGIPFQLILHFCAIFHIETSPKCYWYYPFIIFLNSCSFLKYEN